MRYELREQFKRIGTGVLFFGFSIVGAMKLGPEIKNTITQLMTNPNKEMSELLRQDLNNSSTIEIIDAVQNFAPELCDLQTATPNVFFINSTDDANNMTTFIDFNDDGTIETDTTYTSRYNYHFDRSNDEELPLANVNSIDFRFNTANRAIVNENLIIPTEINTFELSSGEYDISGSCSIKLQNNNGVITVNESRYIQVLTDNPVTVENIINYELVLFEDTYLRIPGLESHSITSPFNSINVRTLIDPQLYPDVVESLKTLFSFLPREE